MNNHVFVVEIDLATFTGRIPAGFDLVEYTEGTDPADGIALYGFDEAHTMGTPNPAHAFVKFVQ